MKPRWQVVILLHFFAGSVYAADLPAVSSAADRFVSQLMSADVCLETTATFATLVDGHKDPTDPTNIELKHRVLLSGRHYVFQGWESFKRGQFKETCDASNDRYRFSLSRKLGNSEWILNGIQDSASPPDPKDDYGLALQSARDTVKSIALVKLIDGRYPLSQIESLPGYSKSTSSKLAPTGRDVFEFSYNAKPRRSPESTRSVCRFELDPGFHSLPASVTQTLQGSGGRESWTCTCTWEQQDRKHYKFTKSTEFEFQSSAKATKTTNAVVSRSAISLDALPDSEFRLSAYGLPEPPGFQRARPPLYVWLLGGAGACFALFVAFRILSSRHRSRQST
jgi:hypothetical protein